MNDFSRFCIYVSCIACLCIPYASFTQSVARIGTNYYGAGIPAKEFDYFAAPEQNGKQRQEYWCWAACIQMVLNYHGLDVQQEDVVKKTFGSLVDRPGTPQQMIEALSGWAPSFYGGGSTIHSEFGIHSESDLVNHLASKWPLIVGLQQPSQNIAHAYVLTAIYYHLEGHAPIIDAVLLRDPYPNQPTELRLSWREFWGGNQCILRFGYNDRAFLAVLKQGDKVEGNRYFIITLCKYSSIKLFCMGSYLSH